MLDVVQVTQALQGQSSFAGIEGRRGRGGSVVQVVPIRGRKTGRIVRLLVRYVNSTAGDGSG
jgi:hypothetical protein